MSERAWHSIDSEAVIKELGTDAGSGLTGSEAASRLEKYGPNELRKEERASPVVLFLNQFKNFLIIILLVAVVLSALVGEVVDAAIIGVIVVFSVLLGFIQEYRAERAIEALRKMLSPTITVIRENREMDVDSKKIVPGDVLLLEAGDRIPADARVVESHSLKCDEAPLTGESVPVGKNTSALPPETSINDRNNTVFTGTTVTYGRGRAVVVETGMRTEFGKIAENVMSVETEKTPLERRTEEIGKWLGIIALGICFLVAGISIVRQAIQGELHLDFVINMVMFAVALAVAAVPEALAAIVTGALAIGMHQMAKRNALVRRMPAVETLGSTTVICSDKTGTITKGEMTVRRVYLAGKPVEVTGSGYDPTGEIGGVSSDSATLSKLLEAGLLCNDSELHEAEGKWNIKGDPTEAALVVLSAKAGMRTRDFRLKNPRFEELPFSSERKRMTTMHRMEGRGAVAYMKGAPEVVLERCTRIIDESGIRDLGEEDGRAILKANEEMALGALRVLALAFREFDHEPQGTDGVEEDMVFIGLAGMMDPPRKEALEAVETCKRVHIKPVMITGDHKLTALAVAKEVGIYHEGDMALSGPELDAMGDEEFEGIVDKVTVYARVSPLDKLKIVKAWKKRGEIVAMTGDGVNDAPALKHADIGVAMGISGTEVAKEAASMVLSDDNFATIVSAIERGRWIYDNIKKYLTYLLRCNITEVMVIGGVVLVMGPDYLPLLPAAILYINLATDGLPALALGVAPPDPDIMSRPPRDPRESVFSTDVKLFIMLAVLVEVPIFYSFFFSEIGDITHARTEMFFLFIIIEFIIAMNFRSMKYSVFKAPPHKWLLVALFWEAVLAVALIQVSSVREAFGINMPSVLDIGMIAVFGVLVFVIMEFVKVFLRKRYGQAA